MSLFKCISGGLIGGGGMREREREMVIFTPMTSIV